MSIKEVAKNLGGVISKNSPTILTGLSCAGVLTTAILAVNATPKALQLLEQEGSTSNLSKRDIVKTTWKCYIPAMAIGTITIVCIIGSNTISARRNTALSALYTLSETALKEYQTKVVETLGKSKETKLREQIIDEKIKANPPSDESIILTGNGNTLCYDCYTGRYFRSSIEKIRQSVNAIDIQLRNDDWVCLNDLYYELGLDEVTAGMDVGFDIDKNFVNMDYSSHLTTNNTPCLALKYVVYPRYQS